MDLVQINNLTDEQKARYNDLTALFEMPGWAIIKKWAEANYEEALHRAANAPSWEVNRIAVGERIVYDVLRKTEEITEREYALLAAENASATIEDEIDPDDFLSHE